MMQPRGIPIHRIPPEVRRELIAYLGQFITENKKERIRQVLPWRTRYVALVLEDIYQPQNASATLRTAEILGVQDIYIVENWNAYRLNPKVVMGASKWVNLYRFRDPQANNTRRCAEYLRARGYRLVATSPYNPTWTSLDDIPLDRPVAFWFGNELEGLSDEALALADGILRIPMYGFTESYNISVSVGITLFTIVQRLHQRDDLPWRLTPEEQEEVTLTWYLRILERGDALARHFLKERGLWPLPSTPAESPAPPEYDDEGQKALEAFSS